MVKTVVESKTKTAVLGFDHPFCVIGERINPTGRKKLAAANFFLPVGFILSPITQKGWSKPKTAVLVLDSTTVLTIFFPYTWFAGIPEVPPFSVTHLAFVFIPPSGKK